MSVDGAHLLESKARPGVCGFEPRRPAGSPPRRPTAADWLIQDLDALIVLLDALPNRHTAAAIYCFKSSRPILGESPSIIKFTDKEEICVERVRGLLGGGAIAKGFE
jgi:hypothetical protein